MRRRCLKGPWVASGRKELHNLDLGWSLKSCDNDFCRLLSGAGGPGLCKRFPPGVSLYAIWNPAGEGEDSWIGL